MKSSKLTEYIEDNYLDKKVNQYKLDKYEAEMRIHLKKMVKDKMTKFNEKTLPSSELGFFV